MLSNGIFTYHYLGHQMLFVGDKKDQAIFGNKIVMGNLFVIKMRKGVYAKPFETGRIGYGQKDIFARFCYYLNNKTVNTYFTHK